MNNPKVNIAIFLVICVLSNALQAGIGYGSIVTGDEPELYVNRFGKSDPIVVSNGYLFVEFTYMPPPYCIQRLGQAIVVNGIMVNRPFNGEPPTGSEVRKYGYTGDNIKPALCLYESLLSDSLQRSGEVVFLFKEGYEHLKGGQANESSLLLKVPVFEKCPPDKFPKLIENILTNQNIEAESEILKIKTNFRHLNTENIRLLIRNVRKCPTLADRIRAEIALSEAQKISAGPLYAKLSSEFTVINVKGYEWKLTVLFDNGLEFYVGRDMEIRNICFATNAITVEAYRDDIRFPLPKTKRIRVAPKLQATIKSSKTGQTITVGLTDSLDKTIIIDDITYQVVDIRADTQAVLLKICSTGERLLVLPHKESL